MSGLHNRPILMSNLTFPKPFITNIEPNIFNINETKDIIITGGYFTLEDANLLIENYIINSFTVIDDDTIEANVTSNSIDDFYDVSITNIGGTTTLTDFIETKTSTWIDLKAGGDTFTDGNAAGNDIRYRAGMTMNRDANGMFFTGSNPWSSWVKFESLAWSRGDNKTLQWILTAPTAAMMIGIGSDATNEAATDQYRQSEINAYFQNANTFWGLYGNNGTVGVAGNQALSTSIAGNTVFKVKFENDGGVGQTFTLYALPSANPSDWDDESTVLRTATIGGSLNPDETNLMPFIIPRADTQKFIALKIE